MDLGKYVALFLTDSREHLQQCNALLLAWERAPTSAEPVDGVFRAVHSIKGMAATLGYTRLAELSHALESVLSSVREGQVPVSPAIIDCCFRVVDALEGGIEPAAQGRDNTLDIAALLVEIGGLQGRGSVPGVAPQPAGGAFAGGRTGEFAIPAVDDSRSVRVQLRQNAEMLGARAALVLLKAELLGRVTTVVPPREVWDTSAFKGELTFRLHTAAADEAIVRAVREAGEVLEVQVGERPTATPTERHRQVRVGLDRLDAMVNQVGELVIARNRLVELIRGHEGTDLEVVTNRIGRLVAEVQESVMHSRMAPVAEVFERFPRPIRDLARQLGKQVRLDIEGSEIELDRAVLDGLGDPLLHLLRNAVDHGLEAPEVRLAAGKAAEGRLVLRAARERNTVLITVSDDGRGVDRTTVVGRAQREGLLPADGDPDDDTLLQILGRPGFTTSQEVTGVSGRGVGIDVVLTRLRAMGGKADIRSTPGAGTRFDLRLPLTLAIVQALLVEVGNERYAVPLAYVAETAHCGMTGLARSSEGNQVAYQGGHVPAQALDELVGVPSLRGGGRRPMVILEAGDRRAALLVDTLIGKLDIVVEPIEAPVGMPRWLNGATILGDGVPVLVLDPVALL